MGNKRVNVKEHKDSCQEEKSLEVVNRKKNVRKRICRQALSLWVMKAMVMVCKKYRVNWNLYNP